MLFQPFGHSPGAILGRDASAWADDERLGQLVMERLTAPVEQGEPETGEEGDEGDDGQDRAGDGPARGGRESGPVHETDAEEAPPGGAAVPEQGESGGVDQAE